MTEPTVNERFTIKVGAVRPSIRVTVSEAGAALDLTGATVKFRMRVKGQTTKIIAAATAALVGTGSTGQVYYDWAANDTATAGSYEGHFLITLPGTLLLIAPSKGAIDIVIED
jgi:hypothetical protein